MRVPGLERFDAPAPRDSANAAIAAPKERGGGFFYARAVESLGGGRWLLAAEPAGPSAGESLRRWTAVLPEGAKAGDRIRVNARSDSPEPSPARTTAAGTAPPQAYAAVAIPPGTAARDAGLAALLAAAALAGRALGFAFEPRRAERMLRRVEASASDAQALAQAAAAAVDKGLDAEASALEALARESSAGTAESGTGPDGPDGGRDAWPRLDGEADAAALEALFRRGLEGEDALALSNRVTGRSGKRWLVFPFTLSRGALDFRAILRVLCKDGRGERCYLDVTGPLRRWFLAIAGDGGTGSVATLGAVPPLGASAGELERALNAALAGKGPLIKVREEAVDGRFPEYTTESAPVDFEA